MQESRPNPVAESVIGRRLLAGAIDLLLVPLASFGLLLVTGAMEHAEAYVGLQPVIRPLLLGLAGYLLLNGWLLYRRGQTLGKACVKLATFAVTPSAASKERPAFWRLVPLRGLFFPLPYLLLLYPILGLLALIVVIDWAFALRADRRCLHDLVAGTRVGRWASPADPG